MDFDLTREQKDIQKAAREFARGEFDPDLVLACDRNQEFPGKVWRKACALGFVGVHYPESCGGQGLGLLENALIVEAFCRQDSGVGAALSLADFGAEMVLARGDEAQRREVLSHISSGEALMTLAYMDEGDGEGAIATAEGSRDGAYALQGKKGFVLHGATAAYMAVPCRRGQDREGDRTIFLVPGERTGIQPEPGRERLGMRMVPLHDIVYRSVRVTERDVLGKAGEGAAYLAEFLDAARVEAAAMGVGMAQGSLDRAIDYSKRRVQFGRTIASFDAVRNRLADMHCLVETARLALYHAAWSMDLGRRDRRLVLTCRTAAGHAALRVADDALQIHGGYGYMTEGHIERFYRDARALGLFPEPGYALKSLLADQIARKEQGAST
ncbi:MAG: acyl-CoA dehydrogenase family protein [Thermodesulfobacteriota bacterium]